MYYCPGCDRWVCSEAELCSDCYDILTLYDLEQDHLCEDCEQETGYQAIFV